MPRPANAIDFWRGFALISIFINHITGNFYSVFTHKAYSISDAAELFVFLAGWAVYLATRRREPAQATRKLGRRLLTIYFAQVTISFLAVLTLLAAAIRWHAPDLLEWHNASAYFADPLRSKVGLAAMTYHLSYFSVLPLYVVLMMLAPGIVALDRYAPRLLLPVSLTIYLITLVAAKPIPTWPAEGEWFFQPFAWQFLFVLGYVLAKEREGLGRAVREHLPVLRAAAIPVLVTGFLAMRYGLMPSREQVPEPYLLFVDSKMFASPIRIVQFLALVAAFSLVFPYIRRASASLTDMLSLLGRNSLLVFCIGSLLSLAGELARYIAGETLTVDTAVVATGISVMLAAAWLSESREQIEAGLRTMLERLRLRALRMASRR